MVHAFELATVSVADVEEQLLPPMTALDSFQIEVTTWCNFACQQCLRTKSIAAGAWQSEHIPFERVQAIVAKLPATGVLQLQGIGEPTMHPQFVEMVRLAAESGKFQSIYFTTNAHTHDDAYWRALGVYPVSVFLSVDSLDPTVAVRCRSGTDVQLLWHRLQLFREVFATAFTVSLVASRLNIDDIEQTLRRIATLGGVRVQITRMMSEELIVLLNADDAQRLDAIVKAVRRDYPEFQLYAGSVVSGKRCGAPFLRPYARVDGFLTPCCVAVGGEHYGHTRIDDDRDWDAIRSDPRVVGWVRDFVNADPDICLGCSLNPSRSKERFSSEISS